MLGTTCLKVPATVPNNIRTSVDGVEGDLVSLFSESASRGILHLTEGVLFRLFSSCPWRFCVVYVCDHAVSVYINFDRYVGCT